MNQQHFNAVFNRLTQRRREVLLKLLAHEKDEAIAKSLHIQKSTVRKHREKICKLFGLNNEFPDERRSKLPELIALFAKYKPELLNQNTSELSQTENFSEDTTISENSDFVGREDAIAGFSTGNDLDVWVRKLRSHPDYCEKIHYLCGSMMMLNISRPVQVDDIYINVNVLEELPNNKRNLDFCEFLQFNPDVDNFERIGLGKVRQPDVPGLEAVARYSKSIVLGKPGAGKTTFLKFLAIECNQGRFQPERIPIFIELRVFAKKTKDNYNFSLLEYIIDQLCIYDISEQYIKILLIQGKFLILLDGLDEIDNNKINEIQREINDFASEFYKNNFVLTCRIAAYKYKFHGFTDIEIADFNDKQIEEFIKKWFIAVGGNSPEKGLAESNELLEELYMEGNEPILELAVTPILLNLICLVFHGTGSLPSQRSKLYEEGVEILLKQWDVSKGIKRDNIYYNLPLNSKKELLSYLAFETFIDNNYFFEKSQIQQYIINFFRLSVNDHIEFYELEEVSEAVLESIVIQNGLLVERAKGIYSFSHLTFHEYFTAKRIIVSSPDILRKVAMHVTEKRWCEVFILASGIAWNADILFSYMKQPIDAILASDKKLQDFLKWLQQKSILVKAPYKLAAVRAFYFTLTRINTIKIMHFVDELIEIPILLDSEFEFALDDEFSWLQADNPAINNDLEFSPELVIDYDLVLALGFDNDFSFSFNRSLDESNNDFSKYLNHIHDDDARRVAASDLAAKTKNLHYLMSGMLVNNLSLALYHALKLSCALGLGPEISQTLIELIKQLPDTKQTDKKQEVFWKWWKVNSQAWNKKLKGVTTKFRNIGHDWQFSEAENKLLDQYYNANKLLINCLNSCCYVSSNVRSQIEDELFLPWDEIQQYNLKE